MYIMLARALDESVVTNIALSFACAIFATQLSSGAIHFIQTGGSASSNTYCHCVIITSLEYHPLKAQICMSDDQRSGYYMHMHSNGMVIHRCKYCNLFINLP